MDQQQGVNKNIIVTGGAGFLGSHLCERLLKDGHRVICIDNFISGAQANINHLLRNPNFEFLKHDINVEINIDEIPELQNFQIPVYGIQEIYHLAVPTSPKEFENYKKETVLTNSVGTRNVLEMAVKYKAAFLQASSSVVYGDIDDKAKMQIKEDFRGTFDYLGPRAVYDEGKRFAELLVGTYKEKHNIDTKIVRIFRTYGSRMKLNEGHMIPDFILNALENKDLVIYGDETFSTSLVYESDIVEGMIKLMESDISEPVNMGGMDNIKIVDVANKIIQLTGSTSKVSFEAQLLFMRPLGLPDISKVKDELGWFPIVSLEDGLQRTIDYAKATKGLVGFEQFTDKPEQEQDTNLTQ